VTKTPSTLSVTVSLLWLLTDEHFAHSLRPSSLLEAFVTTRGNRGESIAHTDNDQVLMVLESLEWRHHMNFDGIPLKAIGLFLVFLLVSTSPVAAQAPQGPGANRVPVLITFRQAPGPSEQGIVRGLGGAIRYNYTLVPGMAATLPQAAIDALQSNPNVVAVEPDGEVFAIDAYDTELANTWGVAHIGVGAVHAGNSFGAGVTVGILDSGFDYTHVDLNNYPYTGGYDFVNDDDDPMDDNGHGTHVGGTVVAERNGQDVVGVAPSASIQAYKVLGASGSGNWSDIIAALERAVADGVQVTNNSYSGSTNPGTLVEAAFDNSHNPPLGGMGIVHVAAAGNSGRPNGKGNTVGWPARFGSVIAVAATDSNDNRASFSSTGDTVELAAPGVGILSTVPGNLYQSWSGTSMASPHVAGVASLIISACGPLSADDVRTQLQQTADDLGNAGVDPHFGFGLVDADEAVLCDSGGSPAEPPPPSSEGTLSVSSPIEYGTSGGKTGDRHLRVTLSVVSEGIPAAGAVVSVGLDNSNTGAFWNATGTTDSSGQVTYTLKNAPSGSYSTTVLGVTADGYTWDEIQPEDLGYTK
jgi:subtilisin